MDGTEDAETKRQRLALDVLRWVRAHVNRDDSPLDALDELIVIRETINIFLKGAGRRTAGGGSRPRITRRTKLERACKCNRCGKRASAVALALCSEYHVDIRCSGFMIPTD